MGWHSPTELNRPSSPPCWRQKTNLWGCTEVNVGLSFCTSCPRPVHGHCYSKQTQSLSLRRERQMGLAPFKGCLLNHCSLPRAPDRDSDPHFEMKKTQVLVSIW